MVRVVPSMMTGPRRLDDVYSAIVLISGGSELDVPHRYRRQSIVIIIVIMMMW